LRKFLTSGGLFLLAAILCFVAGMVAENGGVFIGLGAFWLIMAVVARSRNARQS